MACSRGWSPSLGPHPLCRCYSCEVRERRAIATRFVNRLALGRSRQERTAIFLAAARRINELTEIDVVTELLHPNGATAAPPIG